MREIPDGTLTEIEYPQPGLKTSLTVAKLGNPTLITKVIKELIFLFRIKEDIDYDNTTYAGYSKITNWLMKTVKNFKNDATKRVVHVVLTPRDHSYLETELKCEGQTFAYKAFMQTLNLLVLLASLPKVGVIANRLGDLLENRVTGFSIARNLTDISDIEPYYIWQTVLSPEERGVIVKLVGDNFFNSQNKLLRKYRSNTPDNAAAELRLMKNRIDERLPQGTKATIYGRLKFYNALKKSNANVKRTLNEREGTKQLTNTELYSYAKDHGAISLFACENIVATCHRVIVKPIEIMDLTRNLYLNRDTGTVFYYKQDIESCFTYKSLIDKRNENRLSIGEAAFLQSIDSRAINFVPGVNRRD